MECSNTIIEGKEELARDLGLKEALAIGIGTMIGAGIFVLPRYAIEMAGPGAIISYLLAGVVCLITAASVSELATGMPQSGGDYLFISRSLGLFMGTISGVAVWASLTFAVAFYLQGLGEYLAMLIPVSPTLLALLGGVLFTYINYIGAKESGSTQNVIVGILLAILVGFVVIGSFKVDVSLWTPFLPHGMGNILPATAIIFVSYMGFVKVSAVSEEIKDPGYTIPRSIIGSVAVVIVLYLLILFVTMGILPHEQIANTNAPLVKAAQIIAGSFGVVALTIAALMATASSANASILASSRINFAMGRDNVLPGWLNEVHTKFLTPYRSILLTGVFTLFLIIAGNIESLASSASVLQILNFALINFAVIIMRIAPPEGYEPKFKTPGVPYLQVIGIIICLGIFFRAEKAALLISAGLIGFSIIWYFIWSRRKSKVEGAITGINLRKMVSTSADRDELEPAFTEGYHDISKKVYHILVPLANPEHEIAKLKLAGQLVKSIGREGEVTALSIIELPEQLPYNFLETENVILDERKRIQKQMLCMAAEFGREEELLVNPRILYSHDKFKSIQMIAQNNKFDFLLLGWSDSFSRSNNSVVRRLARTALSPVGILKDNGLKEIKKVLIPYRGDDEVEQGLKLILQFVSRNKTLEKATIFRVISPEVDVSEEKEHIQDVLGKYITDNQKVVIKIVQGKDLVQTIIKEAENYSYDLIVFGASKRLLVKARLIDSIPHQIEEKVKSSVLTVYSPE